MAIALPVLASGAIAFTGVKLPSVASGEIAFAGIKLPVVVSGELAFAGVKLPRYYSGENLLLAYAPTGGVLVAGVAGLNDNLPVTPTGGVLVGGQAGATDNIPIIPTGGVLIGGAATAVLATPFVFSYYTLGGVLLGGAATVSTNFTQWTPSGGVLVGGAAANALNATVKPAGGVLVGGAATVDSLSIVVTPTGGVLIGGQATTAEGFVAAGGALVGGGAVVSEIIPFAPSGGVLVGSSAATNFITTITSTGGVLVAGAAAIAEVFNRPPSQGGVLIGGGAVIKDYQALHVPTGGLLVAGVAIAYLLPSGAVTTAENPTNEVFNGWAFNHDTGAPSRYKDLPATSFFNFNGQAYITTAAGVYAVDAVSDMGRAIVATFTTPKHDFNKSLDKKVPVIYMGAKTDAKMQVRVTVNKNSPLYYIFADSTAKAGGARGMRTTTGKGLKGRYWQFQFGNVNGGDFEFDTVELTPAILERHGA